MIDIHDVVAVVGLAILGWGLWLIWPPLAFVVVGAVLLITGIAGAVRQGKR